MESTILSLIIAFSGYSLRTVSQATQRVALQRIKRHRSGGGPRSGSGGIRRALSHSGVLLWLVATIGTTASVLVLLFALSLGHVSTVGVMAGSGLVTLAIFSRFVSKERLGLREIICISIIVVSLTIVGFFDSPNPARIARETALLVSLITIVVFYIGLSIAFRRKPLVSGSSLAGLAGALAGYVALLQKLSLVRPDFSVVATAAWIFCSVAGLAVMQLALIRCQAVRAVPIYYVNAMVVPVVGGAYFFGDVLHPMQWIGIVAMIVPVVIMASATAPPRDVQNPQREGAQAGSTRRGAIVAGS